MTRKKIIVIGFIIISALCIVLTTIYVEKSEDTESKSVVYNVEKLEQGENKELSDFFLECLNYTFNISDIQNKELVADSIKFQQENFKNFEYVQSFEDVYTNIQIKSLGIAKYKLLDIRKKEAEIKKDSEEKSECYVISYELSLSYEGEKEKKIGTEAEPCEAVICVERDGFKLVRFFNKWVIL